MQFNYLINIVNDLSNRFEHLKLPCEHELKRELVNLSEFEKQIVRNKVFNMKYNVGALNVLKILKECQICSVCDYLKLRSELEKLQIMTDILDDTQSYSILEELIESNGFNELIDDCMKNYVTDLIRHQAIITNEIVHSIQKFLSPQNFSSCILPKFLKHLFHIEYKATEIALINILSNQKDWNLEFGSFRMLKSVIENIMPTYNVAIVREMCNLIQNEKHICWFFILMVISYIKEEYDGYVELKNLINLQINSFCESNNLNNLHKSLILSRQLYHYGVFRNKVTYQQWLKNNIGDLNYKLKKAKNTSIFKDIMQNLISLIPSENDLDIVKIHVAVQISAPSKEYSNVLEYKQLLRSREEAIMEEDSIFTEDIDFV